ncbi:MAG: hypothetical protein IKQ63_02395, partial [Eubacterium sp.]|nr:hypothetical protein [Eubacterium sp.]
MCIHEGVFHLRLSGYITGRLILLKKTSHRLTSVEDSAGGKTYFSYEKGNLTEITDTRITYANGAYEEYFYDAAGNCTEKKTADGTVFSYSYDQNYNITAVTSTVSGRKVTEKYEYDGCGNVIKYTDVMDRDTLYTYDSMNR